MLRDNRYINTKKQEKDCRRECGFLSPREGRCMACAYAPITDEERRSRARRNRG